MVTFAPYLLMSDGRKNSLKYSSALILCVLFFHLTVRSQDSLAKKTDTAITKTDTVNLKLSKDSLDSPINYSASDSIVFIIPEKKIILFSKGNVKKDDMELDA